MFIFLLILPFLFLKDITNIGLDIHNHSYIVYRGEFLYENKNGAFRRHVFFDNHNEEKSLNALFSIEPGKYIGEIVYSERSKFAVNYHIQKKLD